ncbi:hypothetical protein TD95_004067 [Thielaviopsis punctulata]|uniref:ATP-dependent DNA helicase n=1 Tax=Thielaviopsis punctulata TaxID=72032 RepID=A0A0F4ZFN7_9PEZI|nr:hypothetical protein TD95_004067 [Thielaviopsis punctulata]
MDDFDDIDDDALLQALSTASAPNPFPAPPSAARLGTRQPPPVARQPTPFWNPAAPQRPSAPPSVSRPDQPRGGPFNASSVGATTLQQSNTLQQRQQVQCNVMNSPNTTMQSMSAASRSLSSSGKPPSVLQSSLASSGNTAIPSPNRSISVYQGTPVPGSNGKMRQTNLHGGVGSAEAVYVASGRQYRGEALEEPTHHELDREALKTWQYPMNLGDIREYQYSIVHSSLFNNTLVALPTGLGKTLIAATVMLNFYRWTKTAKLVFIAPTRPLVSQQVTACYEIAGIPRSDTTILMGTVRPAVRAQEWQNRRVVFTTPQTLENDISIGYADPKSICLLVVDEAHRATGNYSAAKACRRIMNFNKSFRVLALTATPGATVESVQDVMNNLGISKVEIRTEESIDLRQYTHQRNIDTHVVDYSHELKTVRNLLSKALAPITKKLSELNVYWGRDPMSLTAFTINKTKTEWMRSAGREVNQGVKSTVMAIFNLLTAVAHPIKLLNFHGIVPFYEEIKELRKDVESKASKSKYKTQLVKDKHFQEMMENIETWLRDPDFVDHPKLVGLKTEILNHFMDCEDGSTSKVIVFSEFRDSTEHIADILNRLPSVRARVFVGQAASKRSGTGGMKQTEQIQAIEDFKNGKFNVLVATSIGEEGLDIGQVDLIVCYDASASPIRMLQRMGRTGRKRAGRVVLLLTRGKEEEKYDKANDSYQNMQRLIASGDTFEYRYDLSKRIIPRDIVPVVDKRIIDIPVENSQNNENNPDPNKRSVAKTRKKVPPKKFHMPDGVITGFLKASAMSLDGQIPQREPTPQPTEMNFIAEIPAIDDVVLTPRQLVEFNRNYKTIPGRFAAKDVIEEPDLDKFPELQRTLRPVFKVKHGRRTKQAVDLFDTLGSLQEPKDRHRDYFDRESQPNIDEIPVPSLLDEQSLEPASVAAARLSSERLTPEPSAPLKRPFEDLVGFDDDDLNPADFESDDDLPPLKSLMGPPAGPSIPRITLSSEASNHGAAAAIPRPHITPRRKTPAASFPSSPARLYNVVSDDDNDHLAETAARPNKRPRNEPGSTPVTVVVCKPPAKNYRPKGIIVSGPSAPAPQPTSKSRPKAKTTATAKAKITAPTTGRNTSSTSKKKKTKKTRESGDDAIKGQRACFDDAELGDACDRTSDMFDSGLSDDDGADLASFIDDRASSEVSAAPSSAADDMDDAFGLSDSDEWATRNGGRATKRRLVAAGERTAAAGRRRRNRVVSSDEDEEVVRAGGMARRVLSHVTLLDSDDEAEISGMADVAERDVQRDEAARKSGRQKWSRDEVVEDSFDEDGLPDEAFDGIDFDDL